MLLTELSEPVAARLAHLKRDQIREIFVPVLENLYRYVSTRKQELENIPDEEIIRKEWVMRDMLAHARDVLTQQELDYEAAPTEVAAIWSITNDTDASSDHPRQLKRIKSIRSSSSLGTVSFYRVGDILGRRVSHERGRKVKQREETV